MRSFSCLTVLLLLAPTALAQGTKLDAKAVAFFESKIRPVLAQQCYQCHSQEAFTKKKLRGQLLLDSKAGMAKGGASGPALVPGKSAESLLLKALRHQEGLKMPPKGMLPAEVIADFARWVDMGAPDPRDGTVLVKKEIDVAAARKYWAFAPLGKPAIPQVKNEAWPRTPVDRFILAKLEEKKLMPNGMASKEKLIRRLYYDLTGLPPSPAEVEAFVQDSAADAFDRLVDRLLASEHYGERWARHWLDLARFAESSGYEFDNDRPNAYPYRDFVIKALNQDMPYDEFVRLQVAGEQLRPNDVFAASATGFLVAGPYPGQTTAKTLSLIRYNHLDDMVSTLGSAMLGLSVGCARCHDHKYDPIPQQDYYRMIACLSRTDSENAKIDPNFEATRQAKAAFDAEHAPLLAARDKFEKEVLPGRLEKLSQEKPLPWLELANFDNGKKEPAIKGKGQIESTFQALTYLKDITGIRVDTLPGNPELVNLKITAVTVTALNGKVKETPVKTKVVQQGATVVLETEGANGYDGGTILKIKVQTKVTPDRIKFSMTVAPRPVKIDGGSQPQKQGEMSVLLAREKGKFTAKNRDGVLHWLRNQDAEVDKIYKAIDEHARKAPQPKLVTVFAATANRGGDVNFLIRGEVDKKGPVSQPGFVQVLMTAADSDQHWTKVAPKKTAGVPPRVALANWLKDTDQGAGNLLARVIVNRLWQHHMGKGIVATPNDFGHQGEQPTHPELLDYLAQELVRGGWKLKAIHKLIVTSAVYREDGAIQPANMQADPLNRLWWRHPSRRLEAEAIRDALLAVSGTLDGTMFGPGSLDAGNPRRSVYLKVKRSQMVPFMQMFDAPEAMQSIGDRTVTTVATQSLAFLNSPLVRKSAEKLAQRIAGRVQPKTMEGLPQAVDDAYLLTLSRHPTSTEQTRMAAFIQQQAESYGRTPQALNQALTDFCQVMLCLNEFVYVD